MVSDWTVCYTISAFRTLMHISTLNLIVVAFILHLVCDNANCQGQVLNGEFDNQFATSPDWWYGHGGCEVTRTTEQAYGGTYSALVSGRTDFWNGAGQELNGDLTVGKDYHFQCRVRTKNVPSGVVRIEIAQNDDRGDRYFAIAKVLANDSQWTVLEGGFHLLTNGSLNDLRFIIGGDYTDDRLFDFYVDSVTITENDWRAAADQRIEQLRKRDVVLELKDVDGNAVNDVTIDIQQVGHRFAFGSTLNDGFVSNPAYADFFKQNFDWATIEYFAQWKPVEEVQGVEDYTRADASVEFADANGIQIRGHSLAWPDTRFVPSWLFGQSAEFHRNAINQRIDSVVSRYAGSLVHWDVINEMLNYTYYQDNAGIDIRAAMFQRARENDPDVKLFTNEFGLTDSGYKTTRYRELVQGLQSAGADVGGIGLQSHFDSNVSPKAMELTLAKLTDLGPEIWFTEFDASNPDPNERAKLLETFYRYAFSVPEAEGIIMWGFWAGNHWRGADSAIVDLDWNINAAGQKYFELIDQWTTQVSTSVSGGSTTASFRGFHGTYQITTTDSNGVVNHHLVTIHPSSVGAQNITLTLSPDANDSLAVYGTDDDDVFECDLNRPEVVSINGVITLLPDYDASLGFRVVGGGGNDSLAIQGVDQRQNYSYSLDSLLNSKTGSELFYDDVETVDFFSGAEKDRVEMFGSDNDDMFLSEAASTRCESSGRSFTAHGFNNVLCRSRAGDDTLLVTDSSGFDLLNCNFRNYLSVISDFQWRRFYNFSEVLFDSTDGGDVLTGTLGSQTTGVHVELEGAEFSTDSSVLRFYGLAQIDATASPSASLSLTVDVGGNASNDRVYQSHENVTVRDAVARRHRLYGFSAVTLVGDQQDRLFIFDSPSDDRLVAQTDVLTMTGGDQVVSAAGFSTVNARVRNGGTDTASVANLNFVLNLLGGWIED